MLTNTYWSTPSICIYTFTLHKSVCTHETQCHHACYSTGHHKSYSVLLPRTPHELHHEMSIATLSWWCLGGKHRQSSNVIVQLPVEYFALNWLVQCTQTVLHNKLDVNLKDDQSWRLYVSAVQTFYNNSSLVVLYYQLTISQTKKFIITVRFTVRQHHYATMIIWLIQYEDIYHWQQFHFQQCCSSFMLWLRV